MTDGPLLFARYAYPPNALGYCGPDDPRGLLEHGAAAARGDLQQGETVLREMADRARRFEGAWPYLELIAAANGIRDPLDRRVVAAYWVGNALLDSVDPVLLGNVVEQRFRIRSGSAWSKLAAVIPNGGRPHHSFHVFAVYPWVGLLRAGRVEEPLRVLDQCRVRWGLVEEVDGERALVQSRPLTWDGSLLGYGPPRSEIVTVSSGGLSLHSGISQGDWVSMHWDWVCDRLSDAQRKALVCHSRLNLAAVNGTPYPAPAAVLG